MLLTCASLLWAVEAGVRIRESMTVTQKKAYLVMLNGVKDVPYALVKSIEFIGGKEKYYCHSDITVSEG